ncbi:unnamed protein product [Allacma fusca]|uniref:Major facilitator superfamily (MFS) profile domain-containing protein n=2 Tax=Allacma fusca TaxID=39272 RepID=A0A8J2JT08_9HEXA|nr:unnamed protein product [Allacma fusca]
MAIFGMLPALSWDPISYAVARFLAGVGQGGSFTVYLVHLMEFLTPSWRAVCGCVSFWPLGEMLLGLVAYLVPNWRFITIATAIPAYVVLLFLPYIVESPRWLLTRKRTKEAYEIFQKIARWNNKPPPQIVTIEALQATILKEEADVLKGIEGIKQVVKDRRLRVLLAILTWANATCSIVYYGVAFSAKNLSGSPYLNILYMGIMDVLIIPVSLFMNNRVGRKKSYIGCTSFSTLFLVAIIVMHFWNDWSETYPLVITGFALLARFGIVCCWTTLYCINMETFPTTLRSICMGWTVYAAYLAGIFAPQTIVLGNISPVLPYVLYACMTTATLGLSWFLRETKDEPLKDTLNSP